MSNELASLDMPVYDGEVDAETLCRANVADINRDYHFSMEFQKAIFGGFVIVVPYEESLRLRNLFAVNPHLVHGRTKEVKDRLETAGFGLNAEEQLININVNVWIV